MEMMTIGEIAAAVGCTTTASEQISVISTDSRDVPAGCLFIALEGERFDGHDYVAQALNAGAAYAVVHHDCDDGGHAERLLRVANTQDALMAIGKAYRAHYPVCCIGITGSVGKTTTKDMIAAAVSAGCKTLKTEGNLNNEIGLPKTLLGLDASYQAAVIEMGMQGLGEIAALADVAKPQIGVITNIGVSHLEQLGTRENILKAKLELADALPDGAPLLLCVDNDLLSTVRQPRLRLLRYGIENETSDLLAKNIREQDGQTIFDICINANAAAAFKKGNTAQEPASAETIEAVRIPCIGQHNVLNALAAFACGRLLGINATACAKALGSYVPSGMRQKVVQWNGCTVVEDCYNASPDSMRAALSTLGNYEGASNRVAVLGDMLELGKTSKQMHFDVGKYAAQQGVDLVLAFGTEANEYVSGAVSGGTRAMHFEEKAQLTEQLRQEMIAHSVVWVKGSRGMRMEEILQKLYESDGEKV